MNCPEPPTTPPEPELETGTWFYGTYIPEEREYEPEEDE